MNAANRSFKIVVACGTGIATSTHVAIKLKEMLASRGKDRVDIVQCRVPEIPAYSENADLVVSTAQVPFDLKIPVFTSAIAFLTGIGMDEVVDEIAAKLDEIAANAADS